MELIDLQINTILKENVNKDELLIFYLKYREYGGKMQLDLQRRALNNQYLSLGSTHDLIFLKIVKLKILTRLTDTYSDN